MTILLAGDSLAVGLAAPLRSIAEARGVDLVTDATTGTTAREWASSGRLMADVIAYRPQIVLLSLGTNDARGYLGHFSSDVAALVDASKGSSLRWIGPPSMPFDMTQVRSVLASVLSARGVPVFPSETRTYSRAADGIHMPPSGYAAWASEIENAGFVDPGGPSNKMRWLIAGAGALLVAWAAGWL